MRLIVGKIEVQSSGIFDKVHHPTASCSDPGDSPRPSGSGQSCTEFVGTAGPRG